MLIHGDCLEKLKDLQDNSVDSIVTDPPYGLSFMGKKWDYDVPSKEIWQECLRVLKPGGYLLSFAGTRTQHRMAVNIEDAGFEIRDMIAWVYGSGFPKSLNIGKAVDKLQGNEREEFVHKYASRRVEPINSNASHEYGFDTTKKTDTKGNSEWEGWGTALKPSCEPITVARKPLSEKTVAENVLKWGTGGINIDESRVEATEEDMGDWDRFKGHQNINTIRKNMVENKTEDFKERVDNGVNNLGRFPANLIHDNSDEVTDLLNDSARFFYCAKASKADRDEGLDGFEEIRTGGMQATADGSMLTGSGNERTTKRANHHPTVKPTKLMQYLVKLVTPKGGVVLDPFMGSGSTGKACKLEGFDFIGIEMDADYIEIAKARIEAVKTPLL